MKVLIVSDIQANSYAPAFAPHQLEGVVRYLQKEIRAGRRNVGALKLSNLLQLDRFEEDLNISQVRLHAPSASAHRSSHSISDPPAANRRSAMPASTGKSRFPALPRATPQPTPVNTLN